LTDRKQCYSERDAFTGPAEGEPPIRDRNPDTLLSPQYPLHFWQLER